MAFATVTEEKEKEKEEKKGKNNTLHALGARIKGITPTNSQRNCLRHLKRRAQVC